MNSKLLNNYLDYYTDYLHILSSTQKYILEKIIKIIHIVMIFIVVVGPFITKNITYLSLIILYNITIVTLWYVFGHCCCNTIENKLNVKSGNNSNKDKSFIIEFMKKILNDSNSHLTEDITSFIPLLSVLVCLYKIKKLCKKCK